MDRTLICHHVYEYVGAAICPACGRNTHEPDRERDSHLFNEHYKQGRHLVYKCPVEGGTIRGWWSI